MTDDIVWEEPPTREHKGGPTNKWIPILEPLMKHPKRWARVEITWDKQAHAIARNLRRAVGGKGSYRIPPGKWEFVARRLPTEISPEGKYGIYARYLG